MRKHNNIEHFNITTMAIRNGKIANLSNNIREQLNLRLLEGETGKELAAWLNALPEVQSILRSQFNASPISEVNLTHWRQGGYLQWLTERECFDSARALADGDCNLATTGLSAERLLNVLTVRIGQLLMRWDLPHDEGVSECAAFSEVARKARILQGISRSLLAIHRIQSQSARQKSEPASSSEPLRRGAGGGKETGEPLRRGAEPIGGGAGGASRREASLFSSGKERGEPANSPARSEQASSADTDAVLADFIQTIASRASAETSGKCVGPATAEERGEPIRRGERGGANSAVAGEAVEPMHCAQRSLNRRGSAKRIEAGASIRKILSGPISPASISLNLAQSPFKADLELSELLHAV
jgi:hypothetical protein